MWVNGDMQTTRVIKAGSRRASTLANISPASISMLLLSQDTTTLAAAMKPPSTSFSMAS